MYRVTLLRICKFFVDLGRILVPVLYVTEILLWILAAVVFLFLLLMLF